MIIVVVGLLMESLKDAWLLITRVLVLICLLLNRDLLRALLTDSGDSTFLRFFPAC